MSSSKLDGWYTAQECGVCAPAHVLSPSCCSCQQPRCFCNAGWSTPCWQTGDIILSGSVPKQESEGTDVASCSQLRWLLLPSCCPWFVGFADPCPVTDGCRSCHQHCPLCGCCHKVWLLTSGDHFVRAEESPPLKDDSRLV